MTDTPPKRVLLVNPKSPYSFWTCEVTTELLGKKALIPPLGLVTLAALLPSHWELRLVDRAFQEITESLWSWSDTVMVTGMGVHREDMIRVIDEAKKRGKLVVVGGPYATSLPEELLRAGADFVVRGEAETAIRGLLDAMATGQAGGTIDEGNKEDLTKSPMPRFELLDLDAYVTMCVQTSRGCPYDCEFCDIVNLFGRVPRYKGPEQVIAELEVLYRLGWRNEIFVCDDNFIGNKKHAQAILEKLTPWMESKKYPFTFVTQTSVNLAQDIEMIDLMTAANIGTVFIGIETPDEEVLKLNRKFQNVKNPLVESVRNICANGLTVMGSFIIGFDGETKGAGDRIVRFVEETNIPMVMLNTLQAPPNTALWDRLKREGRLLHDRTDGQTTGGRLNFVPTRSEAEILQEYLDAIERIYDPSAYLARAYNYYLTMRPTRRALAAKAGTAPPATRSGNSTPLNRAWKDLRAFLAIAWRQGVVSECRGQFWQQLVGVYRQNPSRIVTYFTTVAGGENMYRHREVIRERLKEFSSRS